VTSDNFYQIKKNLQDVFLWSGLIPNNRWEKFLKIEVFADMSSMAAIDLLISAKNVLMSDEIILDRD
jgi:hypothetical protein